jgi:hypothetical protein
MGTYINTVLLDRRKVNKTYFLNGSMPLAAVSGTAEVKKGKSIELGGPGMGHLRALP